MIQGDLTAYVAANTTVTATAAGNVYWAKAPANSLSRSHVVMFQVDGSRDLTHSGESGLREMRVQMDFVSTTFAEAVAMRDAICDALDGFKGTIGSTTVGLIIASELPDSSDDDADLFMASADFVISYQKTT